MPNDQSPEPAFVNERDAARILGFAQVTLEKRRITGRDAPPHYRCGRRGIRYKVSELLTWMETFRVESKRAG